MKRLMLVLVAASIGLLSGCAGDAFFKKADWSTLPDQSFVSDAQQGIFNLNYDDAFEKVVDMLRMQGLSIDRKSKAEGEIVSDPWMMGYITEVELKKVGENKTKIKWELLFSTSEGNKLLHKDQESKDNNSDRMNCQFLRYLQTGKASE